MDSYNNLPPLTERQNAETRFWLQILNVHRNIYNDLNLVLKKDFSLSIPKFDVMANLYRSHPEGLTMGELTSQLKVSGGNISGLVSRLCKDGNLKQIVDSRDRRSFKVFLTEKGLSTFEKAVESHRNLVSSKLDGATMDQLSTITSILTQISSITKDFNQNSNHIESENSQTGD